MCVEQKHNELEREYGVINGIRSLYMILRRVVFPGARSGETGKNYGIFGWPFHDFSCLRFPPFLLSLFLVCIDVNGEMRF